MMDPGVLRVIPGVLFFYICMFNYAHLSMSWSVWQQSFANENKWCIENVKAHEKDMILLVVTPAALLKPTFPALVFDTPDWFILHLF